MTTARARGVITLLAVVACVIGCSNPERDKVEHVKKGDQYVADKKDQFAVIEYASAIKIDPKYGDAHWKLAQTYERLNNANAAFPAYIRAADALPENREAQIKAIEILLLARRFDDARSRAENLLKRKTDDAEARVLRANALAGAGDADGAIAAVREVLQIDPRNSRALVTLGAIHQQAGRPQEAESVFRQAVDVEPESAGARLALAGFLAGARRMTEAEKVLGEVLAKEPRHLLANRMLAELYLVTQRVKEAEAPLKVIVDATQDPQPRFQLADYYIASERVKDATDILTALSKDPRTLAEAEARLASLEYSQGKTAEAHTRLEALLVRIPNYPPALTMKARWLLAENKPEALESAKAATAADPQSTEALTLLGMIQERNGQTAEAIKAYTEVLRLSPRSAAAQTALSRLSLAAGKKDDAVRFAEEAKRSQPGSLDARVALVRGRLSAGDLNGAEAEVAELLKGAPNAPIAHALQGYILASRKNPTAARRSFERALELSPGFPEAVGGLSALDVDAKAPASAVARLEAEIAKQPTNTALLTMAAQAYAASGDLASAEDRLRRAVTANPRFTNGYTMLAQLYMKQRKLKEARAEFEGIAQRDPSSVGAKTMVGMLFEVEGRVDDAKKIYESLVGSNVDAPVAANNLAYIYAQQGTNLDMALQLATSAKPKLPDNPNVDDTIGWVYYKKDLASLAVGPLESSLAKMPNNPEVLMHLGLVYAKTGNKPKARDLLARARSLNPKIGGADVERALASISQ